MHQHPHTAIDVPGRHHDHLFADEMKIEIDMHVIDRQRAQAQVFGAERQEWMFDVDFIALPIDPNT